jgi:predicted amidohydrolase
MATRKNGPRPAVIGTCTLAPFQRPGGNAQRLAEGLTLIDQMAGQAKAAGWGLDIVLMPEHFAQGERLPHEQEAETLDGPLVAALAAKAKAYRTHVALPMLLKDGGRVWNALVLLGRDGRPLGAYRKIHPVLTLEGTLENGITPGNEATVFDLDVGRVGAQICFDVFFTDGWAALDRAGAELVLFTSATSGVAAMKSHAWRHEYYIAASTFRAPSVIVDPLGREVARTTGDKEVRVTRIDLDYRVVPWNSMRDFGAALGEKYAGRIRQDWHREEDVCLVTSLDTSLPVGEFLKREKLETHREHLARNVTVEDRDRGCPFKC